MSRHVVLVGAGNIGSHLAPHLARMPGVDRITVVDRDVYETANLAGQDILPGDVGRSKATVQARRIRRIDPGVSARGVHVAVEDVPLGLLRGDLIVAGLDSRPARMTVNRIAWRLGVPWIDAGVDGALGLVRVNTYLPGGDRPCLECGWSEDDYRDLDRVAPCNDPRNRTAPTGASSGLGALAASVQALEAIKLLSGERAGAAGRQILIDAAHLNYHVTAFRHRAGCRLGDHEPWRIDRVRLDPGATRLGDLVEMVAPPVRTLRVPERRWATRVICSGCGASKVTLRLAAGPGAPSGTCARCRGTLWVSGFDLVDELDLSALTRRDARRSLRAIGIRTGDILSFRFAGEEVRHLEVTGASGGRHRREDA